MSSSTLFDVGDTVKFEATFTDDAGAPLAPTLVTLAVVAPSGATYSPVVDQNEVTATATAAMDAGEVGRWFYRFTATFSAGTQVTESFFLVRKPTMDTTDILPVPSPVSLQYKPHRTGVDYTVAQDVRYVVCTARSLTISLPASPEYLGRPVDIKASSDTDSGHPTTVSGNGHLIDGETTFLHIRPNESVCAVWDGVQWSVV